MKNDYLWDKTGEDAEIEALENALQAFRFQENAPPGLPQEVFTVERQGWRKVFRFGLPALAGFASVVIVFSLLWLAFSGGKLPAADVVSQTGELKRAEKIAGDSFIEIRDTAPVKPSESAPTGVKPEFVKVSQRRAPVARPLKAVRRKPSPKAPSETLTAEERYAYNQLMLALSITGTQLRIVKDKVQGIEDHSAVVETEK